jgi:hypothetical protein
MRMASGSWDLGTGVAMEMEGGGGGEIGDSGDDRSRRGCENWC